MTYLLIDLSYYTFYRIFALIIWYKNAHPENELTDAEIVETDIFKTKIEKMYTQKIKELIKKYNSSPQKCILAKDCSRSTIWRNDFIEKYKDGRNTKVPGNIFKFIYGTVLPKTLSELSISCISNDRTEADDIIYIIKNNINSLCDEKPNIVIIANDHDYLQLIEENVKIYNLQNKCLNEKSCGDPKKDLLTKIIMGDKSDNISKVFSRCGKKTLERYLNEPNILENELSKNQELRNKFDQNKLIIDFTMIPENILKEVSDKFKAIM